MSRRGSTVPTRAHWLLLGVVPYLLECAPQTDGNASLPGAVGESYGREYYQVLLQEQEEHYQTRAASLKRQIAQLKLELQEMSEKMRSLQERRKVGAHGIGYHSNGEQAPGDPLEFLHSQIHKADVSVGTKLPSEYGLVPFESFTLMKGFQLEMGLTRHPEEKPVRKDKQDELVEVTEAGLEVLNNPDEEDEQEDEEGPLGENLMFNENDFIEGYYRTERDKGTQYELFFKTANLMEYRHVTLLCPFGPLMKVKCDVVDISRAIINIIMLLAQRTEAVTQFMQNFRDVCIHQDKRIHLMVVYFGKEGLSEVKSILESVTTEFLNSCQLNAEPGRKEFYPVVFSLYNPAIVYANQDSPPPVEQQLVHKKDSGFWRDFGFGMTCQYQSDFLTIDELTPEQYRMCVQSKAMSEASHSHLGMMAFQEEIELHSHKQAYQTNSQATR
ncbi:Chondroitin sulfate N-acetylgalactosaminyltransferase 2 [Heterocephalus glaber]|uniref:Hexosyltransferase n=1 Tax=Heterocephalus glaber TaxID=10181 RepID=G5BLU6_HETGA|nr:Chondroitin sulfate N-acetylgalactosaminyltransferase 2 [Heterocephalus glaber]